MQKLKNSFSGVFLGFILVIAGTILLWFNEGNNVANIKTVKEIDETAITVDGVSTSNNGKLIITSGDLTTGNAKDEIFNIETTTAKLERVVEVYEWKEEENEDDDGNKTYTYSKVWSTNLNESSNFKESGHDNPTSMEYNSQSFSSALALVGDFTLSNDQIESLDTNGRLTLNSGDENYINNTNTKSYTVQNNYITNATDVNNPEVGNIRISYKFNDYKEATVLAVQSNDTFKTFTSKAGKKINEVFEGKLTKEEVIQKLTDENNLIKWGLRLGGVVLIIIGYMAIINPLITLTSFVPILGQLAGSALAFAITLIGLIHSLIVITVAWFVYRPLLSICLIAIIILLMILLKKFVKKKSGE